MCISLKSLTVAIVKKRLVCHLASSTNSCFFLCRGLEPHGEGFHFRLIRPDMDIDQWLAQFPDKISKHQEVVIVMFKKLSCCVKKLCSGWMTLLERCRDLHYETVSSCLNFIDLVRSASPAFTKWKLSSTTSRVSFREDSVLDFETCRTIPKGHFFSLSCFHSGSPKVVHLWNEKFGTFKTLFHFLKWLKSCKIKSRIFFCCSKWWTRT